MNASDGTRADPARTGPRRGARWIVAVVAAVATLAVAAAVAIAIAVNRDGPAAPARPGATSGSPSASPSASPSVSPTASDSPTVAAEFPACGALVPTDEGAPFTLAGVAGPGATPDPADLTDGVWRSPVVVTNTSPDTTYLANMGPVRGVLVSDGRVVGAQVEDAGQDVDLAELPAAAVLDREALTPLTPCADGGTLPPGSYAVAGWVELMLKESQRDGVATSVTQYVRVVGEIAEVRLD